MRNVTVHNRKAHTAGEAGEYIQSNVVEKEEPENLGRMSYFTDWKVKIKLKLH